jgi:hypothetical protein
MQNAVRELLGHGRESVLHIFGCFVELSDWPDLSTVKQPLSTTDATPPVHPCRIEHISPQSFGFLVLLGNGVTQNLMFS